MSWKIDSTKKVKDTRYKVRVVEEDDVTKELTGRAFELPWGTADKVRTEAERYAELKARIDAKLAEYEAQDAVALEEEKLLTDLTANISIGEVK